MEPGYLLVIEDDPDVCALLVATLERSGFRVTVVADGEEGLRLLEEKRPQLVILDLALPGMSGLDLCRTIRHNPCMATLPVLMLTGRSEEDDMVAGFEVGASDYVTKPFSPKVLTARVNALLRREIPAGKTPTTTPDAAPLLDIRTLGRCELRYAGKTLNWSALLTPTQRLLLASVLAAPDGRLPLTEIQAGLWPGQPVSRSRANFDSLLIRLRRLLEQELSPIDARRHLVLRRGMLVLENVRVDIDDFLRLTDQGGRLLQQGEPCPAELAYVAAFGLWQGPFLPGEFGNHTAAQLQDRLEQQYLEASQQFARLLADSGRLAEGVRQLRLALRHNRSDDGLTRLLHQMLLAQGHLAQARQLLEYHTECLSRHGVAPGEIRAIVASFPTEPPPHGWLTAGQSHPATRSSAQGDR